MAKVCPSCELTYSDDDFFCAADGSPLRSAAAQGDNLVGTVIAERYRVEAIVGEGGMGRVYRARHVRVPREAAIKVLRRALVADPYAVAAFNREARNAALVGDHPNVAAVYDFGETADGLVFLAMEFVEGETLARRLEREPVMPPARVVEIIRQIGAALTAAHELPEPVVHRDLKPDNIILKATRDGSDWVKVVDFGIAKAMKHDTQLLTTPGLVVGTPRYMSPEQLTGSAIDARSDIYALALIAFQMLTGRMPFAGGAGLDESTIQWALQRLGVAPLSLAQVRPDIAWPPAAQDVFDRALAPAAIDRTPTASEFTRALGRAFGMPTPGGVAAVVRDERRWATSPSPSPVSVTQPLGAPEPPAAFDAAASVRASTGAAPHAAGPGGRRTGFVAGVTAIALVAAVAGGVMWQWRARATAPTPSERATLPPNAEGDSSAVAASGATGSDTSAAGGLPEGDTTSGRAGTVAAPRDEAAATGATGATERATANRSRAEGAARATGSTIPAAQARAALDGIKAKLQDPDAVATAGSGDAILSVISRLLPTLATRIDSVEAAVYAIETTLILDRPAEACRRLTRVREPARGTRFESRVATYLADPDLACADRR